MNIKCLVGLHSLKKEGKEFWFDKGAPYEDHPYKIIIKRVCVRCGKRKDLVIKPKDREEYLKILEE